MKVSTEDLANAFRQSRNQCQVSVNEKAVRQSKPNNRANHNKSKYDMFKEKYNKLPDTAVFFNSSDLVFYFREKAEENGIRYVIANLKRDLGVMKKAISRYKPEEVCLMIEFLFCSNQNYLDKEDLHPTILVSGWCNKIYQDSIKWANDEYEPEKVIKKPNREWDSKDTKTSIGEWD